MKNKWLFLFWCIGSSLVCTAQDKNEDPELMKVNGKSVKRSEFEYIYNKNNQQQLDKKTLDEYVTLFRNYKLKVAEAEANGIDTTRAFINELAGYRAQLAKQYLVDTRLEEQLLKEAYDRMRESVEVSHILFRVAPGATPEQKEAVRQTALSVLDQIRSGADFAEMARKYSDDTSVAKNGGYLGYISGFRTIYPFETAAYNTPVGEVSEPVLTSAGYHLIKVSGRRTDRGEILTAQIMLLIPANASDAFKEAKAQRAQEIYTEVMQGADFAGMARDFSDDKTSSDKGGVLPWISVGAAVKEYEDAAFALQNKGDISEPVLSPYGWHIIKLLDRHEAKTLEEMKASIQLRMSMDERGQYPRNVWVEKLKDEYGYTLNTDELQRLEKLAVAMFPADSLFAATIKDNRNTLFTLNGKEYPVSGFAAYMLAGNLRKRNVSSDAVTALDRFVDIYVADRIIRYENSRLEEKYPDFRHLMNEYRDGMMLFEISNREVWDKAARDEAGLESYFKKNKKHYTLESPMYKGYVVSCKNQTVADAVKKRMKNLPEESLVAAVQKEFNTDSTVVVSIEKGLYLRGDNPVVDRHAFKDKTATVDAHLPVSFVSGKVLKKNPESYTDVRGAVTADYQNYLETQWVEELSRKYPVEIHEDVLKTVNKH
ncbi:MAG: peptidylprolyl isomerase [Coprobacter sp.]|nr:peptidylprolyl isomerase [Coprobacter sp.]